jgi:cytochrome c oxidase subunit 2
MNAALRYSLRFLAVTALVAALPSCTRPPARHIAVVMKRYAFLPSEIHVKKGETVVLDVTTADVQHGLQIPDFGVHEPVQPKFAAHVTITPTKKGAFPMSCAIICGPGHDDMAGKLVVE